MFYNRSSHNMMAAPPVSAHRRDPDDDEFDIPLRLRPINANMDRLLFGTSTRVAAGTTRGPSAPWSMSNYSFGSSFRELSLNSQPTGTVAPAARAQTSPAVPRGARRQPVVGPAGGTTPRADEEVGWNVGVEALLKGGEDEDEEEADAEPEIPLKIRIGPTSLDHALLKPEEGAPPAAPSQEAADVTTARAAPELNLNFAQPSIISNPISTSPTTSDCSQPPPSPSAPPPPSINQRPEIPHEVPDEDPDDDDLTPFRGPAKGRTPNRRLTIAELESLPDQELLMQALRALGYSTRARDGDSDDGEEGEGDGDCEWDRRNGRRRRPEQESQPDPELKLRKGSYNFGMAWGTAL